MSEESNTEKPVAGDGTQTKKPSTEANWYGPSQKVQEEFVDDTPNRIADPPAPKEDEKRDPPESSSPEPTLVAPETIP